VTASQPIRPGVIVGAAAAAAASAATVALGVLGWRALRHLDAVEVTGRSMVPTLEPGDRLLVETWTYRRRPPQIGDVVVAPDPREPTRELVKRIAAVGDGRVALRGDSAKSTDSRRFGTVPVTDVRARAAFRYWPPAKVGPIPVVELPLDGEVGEVSG
jgi:nickel-type superoxide dismutase maturation protease